MTIKMGTMDFDRRAPCNTSTHVKRLLPVQFSDTHRQPSFGTARIAMKRTTLGAHVQELDLGMMHLHCGCIVRVCSGSVVWIARWRVSVTSIYVLGPLFRLCPVSEKT